MSVAIGIFQSQNFSLMKGERSSLIPLRRKVFYSSLTSALTARFDIAVGLFAVGKIDEDTNDYPQFATLKGPPREDSSSSFNLGDLTKTIDSASDASDEEEALQAQRKD